MRLDRNYSKAVRQEDGKTTILPTTTPLANPTTAPFTHTIPSLPARHLHHNSQLHSTRPCVLVVIVGLVRVVVVVFVAVVVVVVIVVLTFRPYKSV